MRRHRLGDGAVEEADADRDLDRAALLRHLGHGPAQQRRQGDGQAGVVQREGHAPEPGVEVRHRGPVAAAVVPALARQHRAGHQRGHRRQRGARRRADTLEQQAALLARPGAEPVPQQGQAVASGADGQTQAAHQGLLPELGRDLAVGRARAQAHVPGPRRLPARALLGAHRVVDLVAPGHALERLVVEVVELPGQLGLVGRQRVVGVDPQRGDVGAQGQRRLGQARVWPARHLTRVGRRRRRLAQQPDRQGQLAAAPGQLDQGTLRARLADEVAGQRHGQPALEQALERARAVAGVVRLLDQQLEQRRLDVDHDLALAQATPGQQAPERVFDHHPQGAAVERAERHHAVDAAEELGPEEGAHRGQVVGGGGVDGGDEAGPGRGFAHAEVGGHEDDGLASVGGAAGGVGQAALAQQLEQGVEHPRVRLLDLVEQDHPQRLGPQRRGQLAVGRARLADEAGQPMRRGQLRHVEPEQPVGAAEQHAGQGLGGLGLADAGRADQQVGAQRLVGITQAGLHGQDRVRHRLDRLGLAGHLLGQLAHQVGPRPRRRGAEDEVGQPGLAGQRRPHLGRAEPAGAGLVVDLARPTEDPVQHADGAPRQRLVRAEPGRAIEQHLDRLRRQPGRQLAGGLALELAQRAQHHRQAALAIERRHRHHPHQRRQRRRLLPDLGPARVGALAEQGQLAALERRHQVLTEVGRGGAGAAGVHQRGQVVGEQDVAGRAQLGDEAGRARLPLADVRLPGDEAGAVDAPHVAPDPGGLVTGGQAAHHLVHDRGLADARRPDQDQADAAVAEQRADQLVDQGVAAEGAVERVVGDAVRQVAGGGAQGGGAEASPGPALLALGRGLAHRRDRRRHLGAGPASARRAPHRARQDGRRVGVDLEHLEVLALRRGQVGQRLDVAGQGPGQEATLQRRAGRGDVAHGEAQLRRACRRGQPERVGRPLLEQEADRRRQRALDAALAVDHAQVDVDPDQAQVRRQLVAGQLGHRATLERQHDLEREVVAQRGQARPGLAQLLVRQPGLDDPRRVGAHHHRQLQPHPRPPSS